MPLDITIGEYRVTVDEVGASKICRRKANGDEVIITNNVDCHPLAIAAAQEIQRLQALTALPTADEDQVRPLSSMTAAELEELVVLVEIDVTDLWTVEQETAVLEGPLGRPSMHPTIFARHRPAEGDLEEEISLQAYVPPMSAPGSEGTWDPISITAGAVYVGGVPIEPVKVVQWFQVHGFVASPESAVSDAGWRLCVNELPPLDQIVELTCSRFDGMLYRAFGCRYDSGDGWLWSRCTRDLDQADEDDDIDVRAWRFPSALPGSAPQACMEGLRAVFPKDWERMERDVAVARQQWSVAARDVLAERCRQVEEEGWTAEHDDHHRGGTLAQAAACYAMPPWRRMVNLGGIPNDWPWDYRWWKAGDRRRELVKAGALLIAEIERLDRSPEKN